MLHPYLTKRLSCKDVTQTKVRLKIDLIDAYKQVRIHPSDIPKSAFMTIMGTYFSNIMQIVDCNALMTFQQSMMSIFWDNHWLVDACIPGQYISLF